MTRIAFTGDAAFSKYFAKSCLREELLSDEVCRFLAESDYTVVNVEGAVSSGALRSDKPLAHANPHECLYWLRRVNGTVWNLANNHAMDCKEEGLYSTLAAAEECGATPLGIGKDLNAASAPVILEGAGGIGLLAVTYSRDNRAAANTPGCFAAEDEEHLKAQIQEVKKRCRWCVVVSHVGQEFAQMPLPFLRRRYLRYLEYGADMVVGHHPHVVQNYETVGEKIIFYSLGNFIFDTDFQRAQKYTDSGMLIRVSFTERDYRWEFLPLHINRITQTVERGERPAIFTDIQPAQYNLLWPLAARDLCLNERIKFSFHDAAKRQYSGWDWLTKWELPRRNKTAGREMLKGRFLSLFQLWRLADKSLVEYIRRR